MNEPWLSKEGNVSVFQLTLLSLYRFDKQVCSNVEHQCSLKNFFEVSKSGTS